MFFFSQSDLLISTYSQPVTLPLPLLLQLLQLFVIYDISCEPKGSQIAHLIVAASSHDYYCFGLTIILGGNGKFCY